MSEPKTPEEAAFIECYGHDAHLAQESPQVRRRWERIARAVIAAADPPRLYCYDCSHELSVEWRKHSDGTVTGSVEPCGCYVADDVYVDDDSDLEDDE